MPRQVPERPIVGAVVARGYQSGVFDLLVAPEHAYGFTLTGKQLFGHQRNAVHVEQGAIGVEKNGPRFFHASTLFDTL